MLKGILIFKYRKNKNKFTYPDQKGIKDVNQITSNHIIL